MTLININELRKRLREDITYEEGEHIRNSLHEYARQNYVPKNSSRKYFQFMNENVCTFTKEHAQSKNFPYYFCLFCIASQHVYGDCIEECLDNAITLSSPKDWYEKTALLYNHKN